MSVYFEKNNQSIWHCSNGFLVAIYEALKRICLEKKLAPDHPIMIFLETLNQETYGYGCVSGNLDKYLTNKKDLGDFIQLYTEACKIILEEHPQWTPEFINHLALLHDILKREYDRL